MAMWRDWRQRLWGWLGTGKGAPMGVAAADLDAQVLRMQKVGAGNVQVGQVGGNMQVLHQHFYPPPSTHASACAVRASTTSAAHREVLALMKPLDKTARITVLDFMRREFGTAMVIELQPTQLVRVRRYVETINSRRRDTA